MCERKRRKEIHTHSMHSMHSMHIHKHTHALVYGHLFTVQDGPLPSVPHAVLVVGSLWIGNWASQSRGEPRRKTEPPVEQLVLLLWRPSAPPYVRSTGGRLARKECTRCSATTEVWEAPRPTRRLRACIPHRHPWQRSASNWTAGWRE